MANEDQTEITPGSTIEAVQELRSAMGRFFGETVKAIKQNFGNIEMGNIHLPESPGGLTFAELRRANASRNETWHSGVEWSRSDWFQAVLGELGEAANVSKKILRIKSGMGDWRNRKKDLKRSITEGQLLEEYISEHADLIEQLHEQLAEELADTMIYLDLLAHHCHIDLADAVRRKFNAVSEKAGFEERL